MGEILELTDRRQCPWAIEEEVEYSEHTVDYDVVCKLKADKGRYSCFISSCPLRGKTLTIKCTW